MNQQRLILAAVLCICISGGMNMTHGQDTPQDESAIKMVNERMVAPDGLWLTRHKFSQMITPKAGGLVIHKGYIFVSWYQGGMDNRKVWLSRKPVGKGQWKHIEFPHQHVMFRHDKNLPMNERRGDAHNAIVIGICPKDDTVHLLYDMHAYSPKDFKDDYFNYSLSKKGAAAVPDEKWTSDLFLPKRNYLNPDAKRSAYYRVTYPGFRTTAEGNLVVKWRIGGTHNAWMHFSEYDGDKWHAPWKWNNTNGAKQIGFYGGFFEANGRLYARWTHRSGALRNAGYPTGKALYMAYCKDPSGKDDWYTLDGEKHTLPLTDLEPFKIAEPGQKGQMLSGGGTVITPDGTIHMIARVGRTNIHMYRDKDDTKFHSSEGAPGGSMFLRGNEVFVIGLHDKRPAIWSTPVGKDEWQLRFKSKAQRQFSHGITAVHGDSVFYYLMQLKPRGVDARPLFVFRFDLPAQP